ncbi:SapC family protein [uncultured Methylibium sp.]|uniref:SapC family protein n=1 Tax=uncultured Methylibium sp. TaxID=381093 RepID=UPI0025E2E0EC|nr:SapC family protein [uncultured Methylibium sp.]
MSFTALYRQPVPLDRKLHLGKRLKKIAGSRAAAQMNACLVTASEFADVAKEYVIGFVPSRAAGTPGPLEVSAVALLGLRAQENLFVDADGRWDARYVPAFVRRYPFAYASDGEGRPAVIVDAACEAFNDTEGERLIQDDGEATPFLKDTLQFLDAFEQDLQRTRALCARLVELDLLKSVQIDVTLADGSKLSADGVQMIDEAKLKDLPEAVAIEFLRNGVLGLLYAHVISTTNVQRLTERLGAQLQVPPAA